MPDIGCCAACNQDGGIYASADASGVFYAVVVAKAQIDITHHADNLWVYAGFVTLIILYVTALPIHSVRCVCFVLSE